MPGGQTDWLGRSADPSTLITLKKKTKNMHIQTTDTRRPLENDYYLKDSFSMIAQQRKNNAAFCGHWSKAANRLRELKLRVDYFCCKSSETNVC